MTTRTATDTAVNTEKQSEKSDTKRYSDVTWPFKWREEHWLHVQAVLTLCWHVDWHCKVLLTLCWQCTGGADGVLTLYWWYWRWANTTNWCLCCADNLQGGADTVLTSANCQWRRGWQFASGPDTRLTLRMRCWHRTDRRKLSLTRCWYWAGNLHVVLTLCRLQKIVADTGLTSRLTIYKWCWHCADTQGTVLTPFRHRADTCWRRTDKWKMSQTRCLNEWFIQKQVSGKQQTILRPWSTPINAKIKEIR